jgi:uncharacterized membrane protein YkoI
MSKFSLSKIAGLSLSASLLLAACGTNDTTDTEMTPTEPATEAPSEPATEAPSEPATGETTDDSATGTDSTDNTDGAGETTSEPTQQTDQGIQDREFEVTLDDAVQMFNDEFPDADGIHHIEFDVDDGRYEYEIDGFNASMEYELSIDAETGEIYDRSEEQDDDSETAIDFAAIISPQEAMSNALTEVGSGYVKEWELDADDGQTYYDIDIEAATADDDDVEVDAISGEVRLD